MDESVILQTSQYYFYSRGIIGVIIQVMLYLYLQFKFTLRKHTKTLNLPLGGSRVGKPPIGPMSYRIYTEWLDDYLQIL